MEEWFEEKPGDPIKEDFRNFLYLVWQHLGLPNPTPAQYEIAYFMQHGYPEGYDPSLGRTYMVRAFRGIGKSYIAAAYVLWRLYCDPVNEKILVVSASGAKAKEFVSQAKMIMMTMDLLEGIRPEDDQRNSFDRFDVRGASISQQPSLKALGITSQLPGNRATRIVADDIEVVENSKTEQARETILRQIKEFEAIKVPALRDTEDPSIIVRPCADILFLGTPQTEESVYNRLVIEQGYDAFTVPAQFPGPERIGNYILRRDDGVELNILAPFILEQLAADPDLADAPTDPMRFSAEDLIARKAKGKSWYMLQYMLDTTLSDAERYPLKQNDAIVMPLNSVKAPLVIQWGSDRDKRNHLHDIANVGFTGDFFMGPLFADEEWREYDASVMFVDPAGRGKDETAWAVVKALNATFYVTHVGGNSGDAAEGMLEAAQAAKAQNVNYIFVEPNYAGEVWIQAFQPILAKVWPGEKGEPGGCAVEEAKWSQAQKEVRIIDTLEPVLNQHRLVLDHSVASDQTLMYQLTHITRERGCLTHDDRIDALAGAVAQMVDHLAGDALQGAAAVKAAELEEALDDFIDLCQSGGTRVRSRAGSPDDFQVASTGWGSWGARDRR